jgi:hypothetical protein
MRVYEPIIKGLDGHWRPGQPLAALARNAASLMQALVARAGRSPAPDHPLGNPALQPVARRRH